MIKGTLFLEGRFGGYDELPGTEVRLQRFSGDVHVTTATYELYAPVGGTLTLVGDGSVSFPTVLDGPSAPEQAYAFLASRIMSRADAEAVQAAYEAELHNLTEAANTAAQSEYDDRLAALDAEIASATTAADTAHFESQKAALIEGGAEALRQPIPPLETVLPIRVMEDVSIS